MKAETLKKAFRCSFRFSFHLSFRFSTGRVQPRLRSGPVGGGGAVGGAGESCPLGYTKHAVASESPLAVVAQAQKNQVQLEKHTCYPFQYQILENRVVLSS